MAVVKSLVIRGVRSFGPDDADEQAISFESPLTLILGQNGCGKTTIIEALRYAITSQMPPGIGHNDCFIHDPKVNRSTEVHAQIKLRLLNAKQQNMEVTRSLKVVLQKKKSTFRTLDSLLSITDDSGNTKDISKRCADLDSVLHDELGVSRAILNTVIFCHQEESGWPLDEGKKVKERFDEIFDSDKYSNCFDRIKKIRKNYVTEIKILTERVALLEEQKKDLDKKKLDVMNTETTITETEQKQVELVNNIKPVEEKLHSIKAIENTVNTLDNKLGRLKVKLEQCRKHEEELKKAIKNVFEGSKEELKEKISNYDSTMKANDKELKESYKKITLFNAEEEKVANEKGANMLQLEKLTLLETQNEEKIKERNIAIVNVAKTAELDDIPEIQSNEEAEKVMADINNKIKDLKKELEELKALADQEEKEKQTFIDESHEALIRHKQQISTKSSDIAKNKREVVKLEREITSANDSKEQLEIAEKKFKTAEEEYELIEKELNTEETQQKINDDEKELEKREEELDVIDKKITVLQKQTAKLKEKQVKEDLMKQKDKQLSTLKNKHKSALTELLGEMPEKDFVTTVQKLDVKLNSEINTLKKSLSEKKTQITKLEEKRKYVRKNLMDRSNEHAKSEEKLYKLCGSQSYEDTLIKLTATVEKLQDDHNVLQSSMFLIKKYESQLKDNNCCPLCSRGFDSEGEVSDLITQLNTKVMTVPTQLEKVSAELSEESAKKDELLGMKSLNEKVKQFKEKEKPELESQLSEIESKIKTLSEEVETVTKSLVEPEQKQQIIKQIQGDMPLMDRCNQEFKTYTKDFENIKGQCAELESDITLEEAMAKQSELKKNISGLKTNIKAIQKKLNAHNKKLQEHATKKNKLKEECLNLQKKIQEIVNLQENKKQLETDREKFELELVELRQGIAPLEEAWKEKVESKSVTVKKNRGNIDLKNDEIMKVSMAYDKVKSLDTNIKQHIARNIPLEKSKKEEAIKKLEDKIEQIQNDRQAIAKKIDRLKDDISNERIHKRDLDDNLSLRTMQEDIANCEKDEMEINEKLSTCDRSVLTEKDSLMTNLRKLNGQKSEIDGELRSLQNTLKKQRADLKTAQGKDVEKKYRERFYDLHVTKMLDKDLKEYSMVLQNCLIEYHKKKMESINLIIRELWSKIYSGNDIDYIAIKAEGTMSADSERCKYEYRVVQCKNGVEIDMRGRCSAGQKVLACLIIRLALAETFSSRFGVLALDEPTTNLDEENVKSLCTALGDIVQERMMQKNFMFIIITHDREFIESLGQIDKVSHFYEVSRNEEGKSRIKRVRFA